MIQFITQGNTASEHLDQAKQALDHGITWVQMRLKGYDPSEIAICANEFLSLCNNYNATACMNDHAEIAAALGFPALHLGKKDEKPTEARRRFSDNVIIGGTANTYEDILSIYQNVDYVGLGPLRFTTTKKVLSPILGFDGYQKILDDLKARDIDIPVIAIGGITSADVEGLSQMGIAGIAVSGYLINSGFDPKIIENMKAAFAAQNRFTLWTH